MPRIPPDEIERLKTEVSLQRLVESAGIALKKHGKDYLGLCPFHDDHEPSLVISPEKNLWNCLGACQQGGDVIAWVMKREGVSFRHAVELLREGITSLAARPVKHNTVRALPAPVAFDADDQLLLNQVIGYYHETLKQSPEALAYLEKRGLNSSELIERFRLGYANRTLAYRLPLKNRSAGEAIRTQLQRIGVLRDSGHEHFNGSLVVPVFNEAGEVVEVYGRKIHDNLRPGTSYHLYLPGPHRGVWNLETVKVSKEVILCEALIDAMTFWVAGYRNVTAAYGVSGFTADHWAVFKEHGIERVLIAYDRDAAGNQAAETLAKELNEAGIDAFRVLFPKGMDANEYALKVQPVHESLGLAIRKAEWMGQGKRSTITTVNEPAVEERHDVTEETPAEQAPETSSPLAAKAETPAPVADVPAVTTAEEIKLTLGNRNYRIRGLNKNLSYEQLKVNVLVAQGSHFHVDTFDLYNARSRVGYIKQAALELGIAEDVLKTDLGQVLLKLEALQDKTIQGALSVEQKGPVLRDDEVKSALSLLKDPKLIERIQTDFARAGIVGETTNLLVGYLACVSRKLERPLAVLIQSSSAAGKSSLMDAVLQLMPNEEQVKYSAMTGQALFYMGEKDLKHKILAIAEEEGAKNTSYALKLLQSEGEVTIASTGKNPTTGNLETQEYRVEGPVTLFSTTTAVDLDDELLNRCLTLTVDESREQTQAIHAAQRKKRTLEGLHASIERDEATQLHRNAQRLIRPLKIVNPYADRLTFLDDKTRTRRDHEKYLGLIDAVTLLHQYQREVKRTRHRGQSVDYIEVSLDDIAIANRLAHEVLGRTLDELPPHTRKLLTLAHAYVRERAQAQGVKPREYRFTRRELRDATRWSDTALKVHLARLTDLEYLSLHRDQRANRFVYELLYNGEGSEGEPFLMQLLDVETLKNYHYDANRSGEKANRSAPGQPPVRGRSGSGRGEQNEESLDNKSLNRNSDPKSPANAHPEPRTQNHNHTITSLAALAATER